MECYCFLRNIQDLLFHGKTPYERRLGEPVKERTNSVWFDGRVSPCFCQRPVATASVRQEILTRNIPRSCIVCGRNLERRHCGRKTLRIWKRWAHLKSMQRYSMQRKCERPKMVEPYIPDRRWNSQTVWRRSGSENIHLDPGQPRPRRRTRKSSGTIRRVFFKPNSRLIVV